MKIGGGLNYVTGPMGAGKSLYAVRRIVAHLSAGQYVVTNVELLAGWEERVARRLSPLGSSQKRKRVAARVGSLYVYETELEEAMKYRLPGRGEGRGLFVWDEGHNDLNNRRHRERDERDKARRESGGSGMLEWATQLRKLGFVGYLLSQHHENTDAQLRRVCNFLVRLQNQKEQTRLLGLRVTPWPLFLAAWYPTHLAIGRSQGVQAVRVERYFLSWHRHLYDSWGVYHGVATTEEAGDVILLPEPGSWRPALPAGGQPPLRVAEPAALAAAEAPC